MDRSTDSFLNPPASLREQLLSLNGVGPETADSILLYAGNHPVFVVDAYTRRILERHEISPRKTGYEDIRKLFEESLASVAHNEERKRVDGTKHLESGFPRSAHRPSAMSTAPRTALAQVYNEMHGLIVGVGKHFCKASKPACEACPLRSFLPSDQPRWAP